MAKKEPVSERYKKTIYLPEYQRKLYRNKIGVAIFLAVFAVAYPINIYLRTVFEYDAYASAMAVIFVSLCIGMSVGEYKANKKYGEN